MIVLARRLRAMSRRTQDALAEMSAMATEALGATKTVKSFVQEPEQSRDYATRAEDELSAPRSTRLVGRAALVGDDHVPRHRRRWSCMVWWGAQVGVRRARSPPASSPSS